MLEGQNFQDFKSLKALVRVQQAVEELSTCLLEVWPLITTANEGARKLWLTHVISDPFGPEGTAQEHCKCLILAEDEETHIARACAVLDQGQTLAQV